MISRILNFFSATRVQKSIKKFYGEEFDFDLRSHSIFLIEAFQVPSNELSALLFMKAYSKQRNIRPIAYYLTTSSRFETLKLKIRFHFSTMKSAGVEKLLVINPRNRRFLVQELEANGLVSQMTSLADLLELKRKDVWIGDIFYDDFLREYAAHTISLKDIRVEKLLGHFFAFQDQFESIFKHQKVVGVLVSHCVYRWALCGRVALRIGAEVFQVTGETAYRISSEYPFAYSDYRNYPEVWRELSLDEQTAGSSLAEQRLKKRFSGSVGVDMAYVSETAYSSIDSTRNRLLAESNRKKILVAVHDFFDSPHPWGLNFYPDVYQWILRLNELSLMVDYDWYIKTHPHVQGIGQKVLEEFAANSNNFTLLPPASSHHQIIDEGIDFALTIYGTIGMEYPFLGVPVINASRNNPHSAYNFCITPGNVEDYEKIILNLDKFSQNIDKSEILEYYYMHNLYSLKSILFHDYEEYLRDCGGYNKSMGLKAFEVYLISLNRRDPDQVVKGFAEFLQSDKQVLGRSHFKK